MHKSHFLQRISAPHRKKTIKKANEESEDLMATLLARTIIIYIFLLMTMRLMGKRQLGELELSELVSTILLSDIASLPITNQEIPLIFAIIPIITITAFEILSSFALTKFPRLKGLFSTRPSIVIQQGKINKKELLKNRISIDELISELRQKNVTDISDVNYAIIEQNGKVTVIPKADCQQPTKKELGLCPKENGICHILIADGTLNKHGLQTSKKSKAWIDQQLKSKKLALKDIFLMTIDDNGKVSMIPQNQASPSKKGKAK